MSDPNRRTRPAVIMGLASLVALLPALGFVGLTLLVGRTPAHSGGEFCAANPQVTAGYGGRGLVLRYRTAGGQFVRLAVEPFQLGPNTFRVRLFDVTGAPATAGRLRLGFYRLEDTSPPDWVDMGPRADDAEYRVTRSLNLPGWWVVAVAVGEAEPVAFVLRLDQPSRAPLAFAEPDCPSDPQAEAFFRRALDTHRGLRAVRWEEQLTSGLAYPSESGAWVYVAGQAEAPDRFSLRVHNPDRESYDVFQVGAHRCTRREGQSWVCSEAEPRNALDFKGLASAWGFQLGRQEPVDGELTQVVTFYEPVEKSWYAWWVGLDSGYLRRMAMVGPGHFMVTRYFDHNTGLELTPSAGD